MKWEIKSTSNWKEAIEAAAEGWEPFAVVANHYKEDGEYLTSTDYIYLRRAIL